MNPLLQQFQDAVDRPEASIELDRAAALIGAVGGDKSLDVEAVRESLDELAEHAMKESAPLADVPEAAADRLRRALAIEQGFRGDDEDYYDPRNSFLHAVIERRVGIPISLSVVYLEVARRLNLSARGIGFPGHFLVRLETLSGAVLIDPFHGGVALDELGLTALLQRSRGPDAHLDDSMLQPIGKKALLSRMLHNLAGIYGKRNDWLRSLAVLERLAMLDPGNERIAKALGDLRARARTLN